jgi:hypothetical protein
MRDSVEFVIIDNEIYAAKNHSSFTPLYSFHDLCSTAQVPGIYHVAYVNLTGSIPVYFDGRTWYEDPNSFNERLSHNTRNCRFVKLGAAL